MVPRLRKNHNLRILCAVAASLMHLLLIVPRTLADYNCARVASVCKVDCAAVLIDSDNCTAAKTGIKASLSLDLRLDLKEAAH